MTREQEEVIAAAKALSAYWENKSGVSQRPYDVFSAAVRALEESEKPKPKVWTRQRSRIVCSNGDELMIHYGRPTFDEALDKATRALNLLEQTEGKPCFEYRCNKCLREAGPCCTCKST